MYDEYVDDGFSGTSFDRPAFNRMKADIESGKINMIVTKDMSRLGRDYVNSGHYIENYFPEHNVRYIAITDDVDTFVDTIGNDMVPFKAIFNEFYARDISKKIKASITTMKKNGCFIGAFAPYGYQKDPNNKHKLIIDPVDSLVVKRMFKMFLEGISMREIARVLTNDKIFRPCVHKKIKSNSFTAETKKNVWDNSSVLKILSNPNYTGNLYQNRRKKINYKSKKVRAVPKEDWIVAYNTHEAIIDIKTFENVQAILQKNKLIHQKNKTRDLLLQGFMKCKECGHTIGISTSTDRKRNYTVCSHYKKYPSPKLCTGHLMRYENVEDIILKDVRKICEKCIDAKRLENIAKNNSKKTKTIDDIIIRIEQVKKVIENSTNYLHSSYMDKLQGIITLEMYQSIADKISEEININQKLIAELENNKQVLTNNRVYDDKGYKAIVKEFLSLKKPDRGLLANIIDKITIDKDKNIEIYYKIKPIGL